MSLCLLIELYFVNSNLSVGLGFVELKQKLNA